MGWAHRTHDLTCIARVLLALGWVHDMGTILYYTHGLDMYYDRQEIGAEVHVRHRSLDSSIEAS